MSTINVIVALAFGVICFLLGAFLSYVVTEHFTAAKLAQAQTDAAVAISSVTATRTALQALTAKYGELQKRHDAMRTLAQTELDARNSKITELNADAERRRATVVEKTREVDCADLARMPVCPAVADQLWPAAAPRGSSEPAGNH